MSEVKEETQLSFHDLMEINRENIYRERLMVYAKIENARLFCKMIKDAADSGSNKFRPFGNCDVLEVFGMDAVGIGVLPFSLILRP